MIHDRSREAGYSLTETLVATALLLTVLLPLSAVLGRTALINPVSARSEALAVAVAAMEDAHGPVVHQQGIWRVERTTTRRGGVVAVDVRVFRRLSDRPLAHLSTLMAAK